MQFRKVLAVVMIAAFALALFALPAFATSTIDLQPVVDDAVDTLQANLLIGLSVLSIMIGAPLAISLVRRIIGG